MSDFVTIFEVGPRDGLQNESALIAAGKKIELVDLLSESGLARIEVTSFVSPKWVPQMADAGEVMAGIVRAPGVRYAVLTPNMRGYENARAAGADEVAIFGAASETFSQKNINCSIAESMDRFRPIARAANDDGIPVRGYVSCVVECPYEGPVAPDQVVEVCEMLLELGVYEVSLGDTIGRGTPQTVRGLLDTVCQKIPPGRLAGHFHDTNNRALENISVGLEYGLRTFDSSVAGLGGCPYAPGAKGNVATEAVLDLLHGAGYETGVDRDAIAVAARFAANLRSGTDGL